MKNEKRPENQAENGARAIKPPPNEMREGTDEPIALRHSGAAATPVKETGLQPVAGSHSLAVDGKRGAEGRGGGREGEEKDPREAVIAEPIDSVDEESPAEDEAISEDPAEEADPVREQGRLSKHRLVVLCGTVVMLMALFVVFCGLTLRPQEGAAGEPGAPGIQGIQGEQGPQGVAGAQGEKGDRGTPGKSAYEIYCEQYGYMGSEAEWMSVVHDRLSAQTSQEIYAMAADCTVTVESFRETDVTPKTSLATGTGFFIDADGLIMTAYHVIDGATSVRVTMPDSAAYEVTEVVAFDAARDLAILRIKTARETPYLTFETEGVEAGETVYTFGGAQSGSDGAFTAGVVASELSLVEVPGQGSTRSEFRYTCSLPRGNSGAPILNAHGRVIGIVTGTPTEDGRLNTATYAGEVASLDRSYDRSVTAFFADTEYYRVKWMEDKRSEMENNNTMKAADWMNTAGQTFRGSVRKDDPDYYTFEITGYGASDVSLLFSVNTTDYYYPILIPASGSNIELTWEKLEGCETPTYGARATLSPGIYYLSLNGHYSDLASEYSLYTYWRPLLERESFAYDVTFEDAMK